VLNENFDKLFIASNQMINLFRSSKFEKKGLLPESNETVQKFQELKQKVMNELDLEKSDFKEEMIDSISVFYDAVCDRNLNEATIYMINSMD